MGQQQLLLVILVTIIVGIATVVAINVFGSSAENANADAVRQDLLTLATSAEGWFIKPAMMGGGANSYVALSFDQVTFSFQEPITGAALTTVTNQNANYTFTARTADSFTVLTNPSTAPNQIQMVVTRVNNRPVAAVTVLAAASTYTPYTPPT